MKSFKRFIKEETAKKAVSYHVDNGIPLSECVFRPYSLGFVDFFCEARRQYQEGLITVNDDFDKELLEGDIGERAEYEGETVILELPEAKYDGEDVELNSPKRGGSKKFYVYVKNDKGNVIKVEFGDTSGLDVNFDDKEARDSFVARHKCDQKKDKTTAGYWSCNLPRYAKQLGLKNGGNFYW